MWTNGGIIEDIMQTWTGGGIIRGIIRTWTGEGIIRGIIQSWGKGYWRSQARIVA